MDPIKLSFTKDGVPVVNGKTLRDPALSGSRQDGTWLYNAEGFNININKDRVYFDVAPGQTEQRHVTIVLEREGYDNLNALAQHNRPIKIEGFPNGSKSTLNLEIPMEGLRAGDLQAAPVRREAMFNLKLHQDDKVEFVPGENTRLWLTQKETRFGVSSMLLAAAEKAQGERGVAEEITKALQVRAACLLNVSNPFISSHAPADQRAPGEVEPARVH